MNEKHVTFRLRDRDGEVLVPSHALPGRPWIWKPEFFSAFPKADQEAVRNGFHLVHVSMPDFYGSPAGVQIGNELYDHVINRMGLSPKVSILALSRAGLTAYNWAVANLEKVSCIYADNPVCDFKSWPGGKGTGPGSIDDWKKCLRQYGLSEAEALCYAGNPIDHAEKIAKARIPILHVIGEADETVPVKENSDLMQAALLLHGGCFQQIVKPEGRHHPHGLEDPRPIIEFFLNSTCPSMAQKISPAERSPHEDRRNAGPERENRQST